MISDFFFFIDVIMRSAVLAGRAIATSTSREMSGFSNMEKEYDVEKKKTETKLSLLILALSIAYYACWLLYIDFRFF